MNETLQIIRQRRSIRKFLATPVPDEIIHLILEAGKLAPCSMNRQERHFTVIQSRELLADLNQEAKKIAMGMKNRYLSLIAQSENYSIFHHAPLVILVSGPDEPMIESDCAASIQNMAIAAESLGYSSCWVNFVLFVFQGSNNELYRKKLEIPETYKVYGSLVIGLKQEGPSGSKAIRGNTVNYLR